MIKRLIPLLLALLPHGGLTQPAYSSSYNSEREQKNGNVDYVSLKIEEREIGMMAKPKFCDCCNHRDLVGGFQYLLCIPIP